MKIYKDNEYVYNPARWLVNLIGIINLCFSRISKIAPRKRVYEVCKGISFPAIGRKKIEIWYAPSGYSIKPHSHPNENIKLMFLFGHNIKFGRIRQNKVQEKVVKWYNIFTTFNVLSGDVHYFEVSKWPLIFINFETWLTEPTSASEDFVLKGE